MRTTAPAGRIVALDVTRGVAVMGILLMNIVSFAMPASAYVNPMAWGGTDPADLAVWAINQVLFEGRMRGLFALLFGASALLVMDRAERAGRSPVATHLRRMTALAVIGAAHLYLVWDGDILLHYALLGSGLVLVRDWPARKLAATAGVLFAFQTIWWSSTFGAVLMLQHAAALPAASAATIARAAAVVAALPGPGDPTIAPALAAFRGDYAGIVAHRLNGEGFLPGILLSAIGGETLAYMLLGMALLRGGFLTGAWSGRAMRRVARIGCATGCAALAAITVWAFRSGFDRAVLMGGFIGWSIPFRAACTVGYAALAVLAARRFAASAALARIAAVGRAALSNYLLTSIVMTTIFYGYGLGLYGRIGRAEIYVFVLAMWLAMLAWSTPWLDRFAIGPAEAGWRRLAAPAILRTTRKN